MKTKETIAVIGATANAGYQICRNLSVNGYRLLLMSQETEKLTSLKDEILSIRPEADIDISECEKTVSWESDIIILVNPNDSEKDIADKIEQFATGKIVVSLTTPLQHHQTKSDLSSSTSFAERLQKRLPYSKIVAASNTASSSDFITNTRSDMFIASNNGNSLEIVSKILDTAGFNPVIVGDLSVCKTLEFMQPILQNRKFK